MIKNFFAPFFLFCFLFFAIPASAVFINGHNYVSLASWARGNGLNGFTRNRGGEMVLTNRATRLVFDKDSSNAEINGVQVALSFPVANQKGVLMISQLDIDTTVRPLISPQKISGKKIMTICLDPGHGGKDTGNRVHRFFWHDEKTYTLELALELRAQLQKAGFNVRLTRASDTFVELPARPDLANRRNADLFISLHFNATEIDKNDVAGPETYCITPVGASSTNARGEGSDYGATPANREQQKSLLLAYEIERSLAQNLHAPDRGVRRARFAVLRDAAMPAILIEGGYMTHPVEGKKIFDPAYRKQMAAAIVKGILDYKKNIEPAAAVTTPRKFPTGKKKK